MAADGRLFDEWLWGLSAARLDRLSLEGLQQEALTDGAQMPQITVATVISDDAQPVERLASVGIGVTDSRLTSWGGLIKARMKRREYVVAVWNSSEEGVMHVLASPPWTDSRWRRVEQSWINAAAPNIARVLLNNGEFEAMGDLLSEFGQIAVSRMAARVLADNSSYTRGWPGDEFGQHPSHTEALGEVSEGMNVQTLSFALDGKLTIHLRRQAGATFYRGDFALFARTVLARLASAAGDRRRILTGRQRHWDEPITEAIVMTFEQSVASSLQERLLSSLSKAHGVRAAVLHGNPYLHLIVTDYLNGSNFDILATERDRLRVLPGYKATAASMARITDVIGDELGMHEIRDEEISVSVSDNELFAD